MRILPRITDCCVAMERAPQLPSRSILCSVETACGSVKVYQTIRNKKILAKKTDRNDLAAQQQRAATTRNFGKYRAEQKIYNSKSTPDSQSAS